MTLRKGKAVNPAESETKSPSDGSAFKQPLMRTRTKRAGKELAVDLGSAEQTKRKSTALPDGPIEEQQVKTISLAVPHLKEEDETTSEKSKSRS